MKIGWDNALWAGLSIWFEILHVILNTVNWKVGLTQKKRCRNAAIVLSILMKNMINS